MYVFWFVSFYSQARFFHFGACHPNKCKCSVKIALFSNLCNKTRACYDNDFERVFGKNKIIKKTKKITLWGDMALQRGRK